MKLLLMTPAIIVAFSITIITLCAQNAGKEWKAHPDADKLINPFKEKAEATVEGKKLYTQMCAICHGDKGKGDGVAAVALNPKPANYTLPKTQQQSDGILFWKMTEGRPPMASYKTILTETQRWQLVNYLRTFNPIKK